jgi:phage terminase large subunit-like protein
MEIEEYDELGNKINATPLFEVKEHAVESLGDGTGQFLWPRQQRSDGAWFGFDSKILAVKRAQYLNKIHFRAQYYNDPHDVGSAPIKREQFQYYEPQWLVCINGKWHYKGNRLNVVAAIDFAFSLSAKSDATSIVVVGCDGVNNYYILDIERFKTDRISEYYKKILQLYEKWGFRKLRAEVNVAQIAIVRDLKDNYIRPNGLALSIDEHRPSRWEGTKEERINAILEPRYANNQIWHYLSGNCQTLEEELIFLNPPHDDIKDALSSAIDIAVPPIGMIRANREESTYMNYNRRFGGVS